MASALTMPRTLSPGGWLRIAAQMLGMLALLLVCIPFYYVYRLLGLSNPWPRVFLGSVAVIAGVKIIPEGHRPTGPVFLIANHVSWIDIPAISWITGSAFVGHDGLASMPLLKWLCEMNDTVFVARHDRTSVADQVRQVRHAMDDMHVLTIFPEGTTSDGTGLLPFKSSLLSAFEPLPDGVAIQPVLLDYGSDAAEIAWVGEEHGLDNFLRILARRSPVVVRVKFLPPLQGAVLENRKTIAQAAREAVLRELTKS
ncbi:MAG: lysophospholipid acyltransferase family protein [Novosphingobium sp.]|uniref:lysophospholipid acyltransferase family protein n=1 Tax=Novosphingobium sp. TaxID=1874826 RepID=UPI003C799110